MKNDSWVFPTKTTKKLILNGPYLDWPTQKICYSRPPKITSNRIFYFTEKYQIYILYQKTFIKKNCIKERTVNLKIELINWILSNPAYAHKWISTSMKDLKMILLNILQNALICLFKYFISHITEIPWNDTLLYYRSNQR